MRTATRAATPSARSRWAKAAGLLALVVLSSGCIHYKQSAVNPKGSYGDVVKGSVIGPAYFNWDMALMRRIAFAKQTRAEVRIEFFNILNHTNFLDPATTAGSSTFGRITGAMDPRIGQLSFRFVF